MVLWAGEKGDWECVPRCQPCVLLVLVAAYYAYERARSDDETARKHAAGNAFFVLFFCYPTVCNTLFASFICTDLFDGHSVLDADDRDNLRGGREWRDLAH